MNQRHKIRLRGPWWCVASATKAGPNASEDRFRTTLPLNWPEKLPSDFTGTVRLSRKFNCSSGMGDASAIWVAISSLGASAEVRLNDVSIVKVAPQGWLEIAVTDGLQPFNELQIILEVSHPPRLGLIGDVGLEIAQ